MINVYRVTRPWPAALAAVAFSLASAVVAAAELKLSGDSEVPPVQTTAAGSGTITVSADGSVSGKVDTTGITGTMAHIHHGAAGKNGPVVIPLTKGANGDWSVPAGAKLSPDQLKSYKAGELYVNVHSAAHKDGEIRSQLMP
jgi:hypothetical protein